MGTWSLQSREPGLQIQSGCCIHRQRLLFSSADASAEVLMPHAAFVPLVLELTFCEVWTSGYIWALSLQLACFIRDLSKVAALSML